MKKIAVLAITTLLSSMTFGAQFIVIECYTYPNGYAYFSDPETGKPKVANSCGEALAKVPANYFFISSVGAAESSTSGVKYLFSDTPAHG